MSASLQHAPDEELLCWLALRLAPGLGTRLASRLIEAFGHPRAIFDASPTELQAYGLPPVVAQSLSAGAAFEAAAEEAARLAKGGAELVTWADSRFPRMLKEIFDPPVLLYARGDLSLLSEACLAIVGSRKPTPYGTAVAERLASDLASRGVVIVSGLARGIDTAAHRGALAGGGKTIAVLGCGLDQCYPSENRKLKAEIERKGLVLSEFPLGSFAAPQNFPIRNRIISGLSLGVVVVEASLTSGALITARHGLEQGREVFAVPGPVTARQSQGCNRLLKSGAKLTESWEDVVAELAAQLRPGTGPASRGAHPPPPPLPPAGLLEPERRIYDLLADGPLPIDAIIGRLGLPPAAAASALVGLEMKGAISQRAGKVFERAIP